ncbi:Ribonuclease CAF1 [Carpediemonas membranifera]|uniref:poly(A)-specific ribonuclease n=1 Tax=Carpediemonas membranifera TaxID=201153 RepID=A0A8J6C062_9EUKA|nr:Ribonuclease CAF1 [Carpediemonas membranifera]|eukprot:KAG9396246.1 Ribonuclease CAF1 [Carpediemonas membranifera]
MQVDDVEIRDVYASNLEKEFANMIEVSKTHPFIAMDTEFPGAIYRPPNNATSMQLYQNLCANVNDLKIIQLGVSLHNSAGQPATPCGCWQFNFKFDLNSDPHDRPSIELLQEAGIDFDLFAKDGIDVLRFSYLLMGSGLVCNPAVHWIAFHSSYDFLYLTRVLVHGALPTTNSGRLFEMLRDYFPSFYDVKHIMRAAKSWSGGLDRLASDMNIPRVGPTHQAGSDALLTGKVFFFMAWDLHAEPHTLDNVLGVYRGHSYGLHSVGDHVQTFYPPNSIQGTPVRPIS